VSLDVLPPDDARALLTRLLGAGRVAAEPAATVALAQLGGHLRLTLRIAAANLTANPADRIGDYADRLRTGDRLAGLEVDGDPQAGIRPAFRLSYRALPPDAQRLSRSRSPASPDH
jgi:hypothetical protein